MLLRFRNNRSKCNAQFYKQWDDVTTKLHTPAGVLKAVAAEGMGWATRVYMIGHASLSDWQLREDQERRADESF